MLRKDPLIHFLVLGAILFVVLSLLDTSEPPERIVISAAEVAELSRAAERLQGRPPTAEELDRLVAAAVRDEVYYREALARGFDEDDTVVRQRMVEKMRELTENLAEPVPPETDLAAWFEDNAARFEIPEQLTFEQRYFDPRVRGESVQAAALEALGALRAGGDPDAVGDPTPLSPRYEAADEARIRTLFGEDFTAAVFAAATGEWIGPLESGFGWHLVRVLEHSAARDPAFAEVEAQVREAYAAERLAAANAAAFAEISSRYEVAVEWQSGAEPRAWP